MKVLFAQTLGNDAMVMLNYSFGLISMAAVLKRAGHEVFYFPVVYNDFLDCDGKLKGRLKRRIEEFRPDVVGISSGSDFFGVAKEIIRYVNELFLRILIIIRGAHATCGRR